MFYDFVFVWFKGKMFIKLKQIDLKLKKKN